MTSTIAPPSEPQQTTDEPAHPPAWFSRLARWSARHRRGVMATWLVATLLAAPLALTLTHALSGAGWEAQGSVSVEVRDELRSDFPELGAEAAVVVYQQADPIADDPAGLQALLADLERFGLVQSVPRGGSPVYGPAALEVARLASRYAELGVEPRHLRMYLVAAEREAGMVEQLAVPLLKQRNPQAQQNAAALAGELAELGAELHRSLLRREVGSDLLP